MCSHGCCLKTSGCFHLLHLRVDGGSADDEELVCFVVNFEFHFFLFEGEVDRGIGREGGLVGRFGLADLVFIPSGADGVLLALRGGLSFGLLLGVARDGGP
jgi:hypothetical protein